MCQAMSFDARFDCENFLLIAGICQKTPQFFFPLQKQKKQIGLDDAHWIARRSSWEHFTLRWVLDLLSGQGNLGCRSFFSIVFALCHILLLLSSRGTLAQVCACHYPSLFAECPCDLGITLKTFQWSFLRIFLEKTRLFGKIFVFGLVVFYSAHNCQLQEPRSSETSVAKQRLTLFLELTKFVFQLNFV